MSRKPQKGYFVQGQFVAEGSELDLEMQRQFKGDKPSRSDLKRESTELQLLGTQLLELGATAREQLALGEKLEDALAAAQNITKFEGRRRQMQFVGKLMRGLDATSLLQIRAALQEQHQGSAQQTAQLHAAQRWRDELIRDDAGLQRWLDLHPQTDIQQLRMLIRQARKDEATLGKILPGEAARHGRAYREMFQMIRQEMMASDAAQESALQPTNKAPSLT